MVAHDALRLADLESHDPRAPQKQGERRFCCPFCGGDKPIDAAHRSLAVSMETGAWNCHRCHERGKLREWWSEPAAATGRTRPRRAPSKNFALPPLAPRSDAPAPTRTPIADTLPALAGTPGEAYLKGRGLPLALCHAAGVRYAQNWHGLGAAVVFPVTDCQGREVAAQARFLTRREKDPDFNTEGPKKQGVFATPGAWHKDTLALTVTEAPIDALSLAENGWPAVAFLGKDWPDWFPRLCFGLGKRVFVAFDADTSGEEAAAALMAKIGAYSPLAERLRPLGVKDWNEDLLRLADCRRLCRKLARQAHLLQSGEPHPSLSLEAMREKAQDTYRALVAACVAAEGEGAAGYADALDPFAAECLSLWEHALQLNHG